MSSKPFLNVFCKNEAITWEFLDIWRWKHWRPNYAGFRSLSIAESPPALAIRCKAPDQVRMWWFTFICSQLNKGVRGGGRVADKERKQSLGCHWRHSRSDVWTFLCVNQGHRGKWALWEDVLRQAYLKSCSLNQHDTPLSTVHRGYAERLLLCWISFLRPSFPFSSKDFLSVCVYFSKLVYLFWRCLWKKRWEERINMCWKESGSFVSALADVNDPEKSI